MRVQRILALCLLLAILVTSFCGCGTTNFSFEKSNALSDENANNSNESVISYSTYNIPSILCCSVITNKDAPENITNSYNYGDEVDIWIYILIDDADYAKTTPFLRKSLKITIKESPAFEIIGENTFEFNLYESEKDYTCASHDQKPYEKDSISFNFKIKLPEESYGINKVNSIEFDAAIITNEYRDIYMTDEFELVDTDTRNVGDVPNLMFLTDPQGVIIHSMPYSYNYYYFKKEEYYGFKFDQISTLLSESYNREYKNGVSVEELLDRHVQLLIENRVSWKKETIRKLKFKFWFIRIYETSYSVNYISKDVRFKIYYTNNGETLLWEDTKQLLDYALSEGVITEEEYTTELWRLNQSEIKTQQLVRTEYYRWIKNTNIDFPVDFEVPEGDNYYNHVSDLRTGNGKINVEFKFGKD